MPIKTIAKPKGKLLIRYAIMPIKTITIKQMLFVVTQNNNEYKIYDDMMVGTIR